MTRQPLTSLLTVAAALGAVLLSPAPARAQSGCTTSADCPEGLICQVTGGSACAAPACPEGEACPEPEPCEPEVFTECVAPACASDADCGKGMVCEVSTVSDCPDVACAEGQTCPEPGPCIEEQYASCVAAPCSTDADCGEGLVCLEFKGTSCAVPVVECAPGTDCVPPEPVCEDQTESRCAPPYVGPCEVDADCGEGFLCVEQEICTCSGSAGSAIPPSSDAAAGGGSAEDPAVPSPAPPPEESCSCEPSGTKSCELQQLPCTSAADCPAEWNCEVMASAGTCSAPADGGEAVCDPVVSEQYCRPPDWNLAVGEQGGSDAGGTVSREEPPTASGESGATDTGDADEDTGFEVGPAEAEDDAAAGDPPASSETSRDSGGCSLTASAPGYGSASWLLGLVALGWLRRRKTR